MSTRSLLKVSVLASIALIVTLTDASCGNERKRLQITALPNEGLLIQAGETGVLIDAFIDPRNTEGDSVLSATRRSMIDGVLPFANIQLALVSHEHGEHFHAPTAEEYLRNNRNAILASSSAVIKALQTDQAPDQSIKEQLVEFSIHEGEITSEQIAGIRCDVMPLRHETSMFFPEMVLGHIIHIADKSILYTGDSEMQDDNWAPFNLKAIGIDIAVVPSWLYSHEQCRKIIDEHVAPENIILVKVPPAGQSGLDKKQTAEFPDNVYILDSVMSTVEF